MIDTERKIIINLIKLDKDFNESLKHQTLDLIKSLSKIYHIKLSEKRGYKFSIPDILILFLENKNGYIENINKLYNVVKHIRK